MDKVFGRLTVFFEEPFWVGVFEVRSGGKLSAAKLIFGAEPKDNEVYEWVLKNYVHLCFSPAVAAAEERKSLNPKRKQRKIREELLKSGVGTKSQQALKLLQEQGKQMRRKDSKLQRLAEEKRRFTLKQQKKKERHRGH